MQKQKLFSNARWNVGSWIHLHCVIRCKISRQRITAQCLRFVISPLLPFLLPLLLFRIRSYYSVRICGLSIASRVVCTLYSMSSRHCLLFGCKYPNSTQCGLQIVAASVRINYILQLHHTYWIPNNKRNNKLFIISRNVCEWVRVVSKGKQRSELWMSASLHTEAFTTIERIHAMWYVNSHSQSKCSSETVSVVLAACPSFSSSSIIPLKLKSNVYLLCHFSLLFSACITLY